MRAAKSNLSRAPLVVPSATSKFWRAQEHISELDGLVRAYLEDPPPYRVVREPDIAEGLCRYRFRLDREIPHEVTVVLGDAVHNLRASLDHAVCELVLRNGQTISRDHSFPMMSNRTQDVEKQFRRRVGAAGPRVLDAVRREEPFEGADNPLWTLHKLDIRDKHQSILMTLAKLGRMRTKTTIWGDAIEAKAGRDIRSGKKVFSRPGYGRLEDGHVLLVDRAGLERDDGLSITIHVAFDMPPLIQARPVMLWLNRCAGHVAGVVTRLAEAGGQSP